jgi:hypothetical protein
MGRLPWVSPSLSWLKKFLPRTTVNKNKPQSVPVWCVQIKRLQGTAILYILHGHHAQREKIESKCEK